MDAPTTAPNRISAVVAACPDDTDLTLHRLGYFFFSMLHETLGTNNLYIGYDVAPEEWKVSRKFRERSDVLPEVFLRLPDETTGPLSTVRRPKKKDVWSYRHEPIGGSSLIPQSETLPPMPYDIGHIIYREKGTVVDLYAPDRGTIRTKTASKVGPTAGKRMRILHVQTAFHDDSDVVVLDASTEDGGVEQRA